MLQIPYWTAAAGTAVLWLLARALRWKRTGRIDWAREGVLLLVLVCLLMILRFTFFPFERESGRVLPLTVDLARLRVRRVNLVPFVNLRWLMDTAREFLKDILGNMLLFVPVGLLWPAAFRRLDTFGKTVGAGALLSLIIEILQLPLDRVSDVDDLILNTLGCAVGYGLYALVRRLSK